MGWECIMNAVDFVDTPNLSLFLKKKRLNICLYDFVTHTGDLNAVLSESSFTIQKLKIQ